MSLVLTLNFVNTCTRCLLADFKRVHILMLDNVWSLSKQTCQDYSNDILFSLLLIWNKPVYCLISLTHTRPILTGIYSNKVNNGNTRTMCETCSKLTLKKLERRQWRRSVVFLLTLNRFLLLCWCFHYRLLRSNCCQEYCIAITYLQCKLTCFYMRGTSTFME